VVVGVVVDMLAVVAVLAGLELAHRCLLLLELNIQSQ
jgi:hypothetical protein